MYSNSYMVDRLLKQKDEIENSFNINTYPNNLCNNDIIIWCSDDYSLLENASSFKIEAKDDRNETFEQVKPILK